MPPPSQACCSPPSASSPRFRRRRRKLRPVTAPGWARWITNPNVNYSHARLAFGPASLFLFHYHCAARPDSLRLRVGEHAVNFRAVLVVATTVVIATNSLAANVGFIEIKGAI